MTEINKPWENDIRLVLFMEPTTKYKCLIRRVRSVNVTAGHLCGYVIIPKNHQYYNTSIDYNCFSLEVHGGITYSDFMDDIEIEGEKPFCIGFDCAHSGDLMPNYDTELTKGLYEAMISAGCVYRNVEYVKNECVKLAKQLKEVE
jgi:hypothetical protein